MGGELNEMKTVIKSLVKKSFNTIGLDIARISNRPEHTLLGLRHLPIRSIIDVGANTGQFARNIATVFPEAYIYSFEPLLQPFDLIKQWARKQQGKITVFNVALGDHEGTVEMFSHLEHSPSSSLLKSTDVCERLYPFTKKQTLVSVALRTLDRFLTDMSITLVPDILIKLDVQGYEDRVITGGQETFGKAVACIVEINLDPLYEDQANLRDIFILLDELGYYYAGNLQQAYADEHVVYIDAMFIKRAGAYDF